MIEEYGWETIWYTEDDLLYTFRDVTLTSGNATAAGMVKAAISIILKGKEFDFTSSSHVVGTLNSVSFQLLLFFVPSYSTEAIISRSICAISMAKEKEENKIVGSCSLVSLSYYQGTILIIL